MLWNFSEKQMQHFSDPVISLLVDGTFGCSETDRFYKVCKRSSGMMGTSEKKIPVYLHVSLFVIFDSSVINPHDLYRCFVGVDDPAVVEQFMHTVIDINSRFPKLDAWFVKLENFNIPKLQTYVNGIRQDVVAVKNGIAMQYNNSLPGGSVNKLKVIKHIMYGRNSFELLKAKILFTSNFAVKSTKRGKNPMERLR